MSRRRDKSSDNRRQEVEAPLELELVFVDADDGQTRLRRAMKIILQAGCRAKGQDALRRTAKDDHVWRNPT